MKIIYADTQITLTEHKVLAERTMIMWLKTYCSIVLILATSASFTDALAVMSVDLGSEYMKIAIVKPGVPMEIALNHESRRKTSVVVSLKNGERLFSDPALNVAVKYPKSAYKYLQDLLAKSKDNPVVKRYQKRFPYYDLVEEPETKTIVFKHSDEETFTPEELLAMIMEHAKHVAEKFAEQPINDAVITVPPYFNQAERRAMMRAGELAGLKILQLMNDNTAVALNYGIFRRKAFNSTAVYYMFFDMGATSTSVSIVSYQEVKEKNKITGTLDKYPQLQVKGVGFDRNLGGLEFQLRLRDHLAQKFNEKKVASEDVRNNKRAMAKLFKEAGRLKNVLSANVDHMAQVEGLFEDHDFRVKVTREEFETMCADLFDRVGKVVTDALKSSEFTMEEISEVILMGGSTRMPKVQEQLQKATGRLELGKSINTDEAAALGAVYQAAHLSKGFKVKKFSIKEATIYPIQVDFERAKQSENGEVEKKTVTRTLFGRNNAYPQKKVMTFNKHTADFDFEVNYGDVSFLSEEELQSFGSRNLQKISLTGVADAFGKHKDEADSKGVKAHFKVEESGILELDRVELVFERQPIPAEEKPEEEQSTLEKIGSAFGSLFGGGSEPTTDEKESTVEKNVTDRENKTESEPVESKTKILKEEKADDEKKSETKKPTETPEKKKKEKKKDDQPPPDDKKTSDSPKTDEKKDESSSKDDASQKSEKKTEEKKEKKEKTEDADKKEKVKKDEKPKIVTIREDIKAATTLVDRSEPSKDTIKASRKKIRDLKKKDEEKALLEMAKNDLESFIIETQDKLYQVDYEECSTQAEREEYSSKLSEASDWLYEQEEHTGREAYTEKLSGLKKMLQDVFERVKEKEERPRAIEALNHIMNYSRYFLVSMKNFTGDEVGEQPFTMVEYSTLDKLINSTQEWNDTILAEQIKTPNTEKPKVTIQDFARKISDLDREVKYLVNKAKTFRPKPPKKEESKKNSTKTGGNKTEEEGEEIVAEEEEMKPDIKLDIPVMEDPDKEDKKKTKDTEEEEVLQLDGDAAPTGDSEKEVETEEQKQSESKSDSTKDSEASDNEDTSKSTNSDKPHDPQEL